MSGDSQGGEEVQSAAGAITSPAEAEVSGPIEFAKFLEEFPLNTSQDVTHFWAQSGAALGKLRPQLRLWCKHCEGYRRFDGLWTHSGGANPENVSYDFLKYTCRDCAKGSKTFCLAFIPRMHGCAEAVKLGEFPEVHIDLPSYLPTLLGEDYGYFIKGLKAEKCGLGVGAFAYYRRVVEDQKGRLFDKMAKAASKAGSPLATIKALEEASRETQFAKAIEGVKDHFPGSLLVDGHNPMKLLHRALSVGLHERDDAACLKLAHSIRMVLQDLSVRIKDALREERQLKEALSDLLQIEQKASGRPPETT